MALLLYIYQLFRLIDPHVLMEYLGNKLTINNALNVSSPCCKEDPFQPIMDIVKGSIIRRDEGIVEEGLSLVKNKILIFLDNYEFNDNQQTIFSGLINYHISDVYFLANSQDHENLKIKIIKTTKSIGIESAKKNLDIKGISLQEWSFMSHETRIKYREGKIWGTMMGAYGACYAIRNELFTLVPDGYTVDDFFITMKVLEQKYKCILDLDAILYNIP